MVTCSTHPATGVYYVQCLCPPRKLRGNERKIERWFYENLNHILMPLCPLCNYFIVIASGHSEEPHHYPIYKQQRQTFVFMFLLVFVDILFYFVFSFWTSIISLTLTMLLTSHVSPGLYYMTADILMLCMLDKNFKTTFWNIFSYFSQKIDRHFMQIVP